MLTLYSDRLSHSTLNASFWEFNTICNCTVNLLNILHHAPRPPIPRPTALDCHSYENKICLFSSPWLPQQKCNVWHGGDGQWIFFNEWQDLPFLIDYLIAVWWERQRSSRNDYAVEILMWHVCVLQTRWPYWKWKQKSASGFCCKDTKPNLSCSVF